MSTTSQTPPLPAEEPTADFQPPLPDEPVPEAAPTRPAAAVEEAEEDDSPPSTNKGKGKQVAGGSDKGESDGEWDPAATSGEVIKDRKVEEKAATTTGDTGGWQAVWAPAQNAYYFWNATTGAVQWDNPLQPATESQPPLPEEPAPAAWSEATPTDSLPAIDPALAHLLPASQRSGTSNAADAHLYQTAQFNARTGRFTPRDYQFTVDHLAEANRARRQEMAFFDVAEWEKEKEEEVKRKREREAAGEGPRKLTKKDMERFRAKKQEKKTRNNAWLKG
ncbi:hypothetical protein QFC20_005211 [Naganishia adeliensis]|uniref:Uncharacterized protein n=1 Tax=Naganishia adeliensis TaxID=92952 RepID=A0ACC2VQR3_9TREE|nr:hypothetical protein QFC20_005211 [Naganishia adeliensis]